MQLKAPQISVKQAGLRSVSIGQLGVGPISVGSLTLNNTNFTLQDAHGLLQQVQVTVTIKISVEWHIHVGLPDGIPDIDLGDTYNLGSFSVSLPVGDITIPSLTNFKFDIPTATAQNLSVRASPVAVQINNVAADNIHAADAVLPRDGFTLTGLGLTSLTGTGLGVPAATVAQATVQHLHGDPAKLPAFSLDSIQLASVQIPSISSAIPVSIPADLETIGAGFDAGILRVVLHLAPSVLLHTEHLQITNATATASVGQLVLHDVTLPYDALNITLSQIGVDTIDIPNFTIA